MKIDMWKADIAVLERLNTRFTDQLEVERGYLKLTEGKEYRGYRGHSIVKDPNSAKVHFKQLIEAAKLRFEYFKKKENLQYDELATFNREVKCLSTQLSKLQYTFREFDLNNEGAGIAFSQLFDSASNFQTKVREHKTTMTKPPLESRPIKRLNWNKRSCFVGAYASKRTPVDEIVKAANKALEFSRKEPQNMAEIATNTLSWVVSGNFINSQSPVGNYYDECNFQKIHAKAFQDFAQQLLRRPVITMEVANAFAKLSPEVKLLNLCGARLGSLEMSDLAPYIEEKEASLSDYLALMKNFWTKEYPISFHYLAKGYKWYEECVKTKRGLKTLEELLHPDCITRPCRGAPFITLDALNRVLNAVSVSETCRKIEISSDLLVFPPVLKFLLRDLWKLESKARYASVYIRE